MNNLFKVAVMAGLMASAGSAMADTSIGGGTIYLKAQVSADSCSVSNDTRDQTVDMGTIGASGFTGVGAESSRTVFHIKLMDCPASTTTVGFSLADTTVGSADSADANLLALDSTSTASGFGVAIYDAATGGSVIKPGSATAVTKYPVAGSQADIALSAALKQDTDGGVTAGDFTAVTGFSVVYN